MIAYFFVIALFYCFNMFHILRSRILLLRSAKYCD